MTKLYLPKYCILEVPIRENTQICESAKIYFGELAVLASKYNHIPYTDEQLAEMKEVGIRTIKRWHEELEKENFISRVSKNHLVEGEKCKWRKERKMYICQNPDLKKYPDSAKSGTFDDSAKSGTFDDSAKSGTITEDTLNKTENNNTEPVVVPPLEEEKEESPEYYNKKTKALDTIDLPAPYKMKLCSTKSLEDIQLLVTRVQNWEERESDHKACNTIIKSWDTWNDTIPEEIREETNKQKIQELFGPFEDTIYDSSGNIQKFGEGIQIHLLGKYAEIVYGAAQPKIFNYKSKNSVLEMIDFVKNRMPYIYGQIKDLIQ